MSIAAAIVCLSAFASFGWGVLSFFKKPAGPSRRAMMTAALGVFFGVWQIYEMATATSEAWRVVIGIAAHAASAWLFWSAVKACQSGLTAIFEADLPIRLVDGGPYAYVRHPFYCSYAIFWLAGWITSGSVVGLLSVLVMAGIYVEGAIEEERKFARSALATRYADYRQRVGACLPRLRRRTATGPSRT